MKKPSLLDRLLGRGPRHEPNALAVIPGADAMVLQYVPPGIVRAGDMDMADALENRVSGLGTVRDKRYYSTYTASIPLTEQQLETMYVSTWLAPAIVDTPIEDMTREWVTPQWTGITKEHMAAIRRVERKFDVKTKTVEAMTWAGLYAGGSITVGIKGQDLAEPLVPASIRKGSLQFLHARDRFEIYPDGRVNRDENDMRTYGKPLFYSVRGSTQKIHCSRLIRFEGRRVPLQRFLRNGYWHDSELQHVVSATKDFDGAVDNAYSMLWEAKIDVIKTSLSKLLTAKNGEQTVDDRYLAAAIGKGNHRMLLLNKDEEYETKTQSFAGVNDMLGTFIVLACAAAKIPMVKLFGQSVPGMNSTGETDIRLYYDRIAAEAEWKMLPGLTYLYEILLRSELGFMPDDLEIVPNPLWQVSAKERAEIEEKRSQRDERYWKMGAASPGLIARQLKADGTYSQMEDADVTLAEELEQPIDPEESDDDDADDPADDPKKP